MHIERVRDAASDAVADYARLTDVALRSVHEPEQGLYIAESAKVIRRAIAAGHRPRSVLMEEKWLAALEPVLAPFDIPVHLADPDQLEAITGYRVHRGALAAFERPELVDPAQLLAGARRVVVLEDTSTTGGSALTAVEGVRKADGDVRAVAVIVDRDTGAKERIEKEAGVPYLFVFGKDELGLD